MSKPRTIVLGISGGIAAYKTPSLIRLLKNEDFRVIPVTTQSATKFVTSHTLAAVSEEQVRSDLWDETAERAMSHIELAKLADIVLIAPTTAHLIGKLANGLADDLLSTLVLATTGKVVLAPAMNQAMYQNPIVQRNLQYLQEMGVKLIGPNSGEQACGDVGPGRMSEPEEIVQEVMALKNPITLVQDPALNLPLTGRKVVVTAGPTRESIDPVRYLSNASSGRQGFAIAKAAAELGANVVLVTGPVGLQTPSGVERVDVTTAHEMYEAVIENLDECAMLFAVAAVADYKPRTTYLQKIKKSDAQNDSLVVELESTVDIVHEVSRRTNPPYLVGFAAETTNIQEHARAKRLRKGLDVIVLNDVSQSHIGFDSPNNQVTLIDENGELELSLASKDTIAKRIVEEVVTRWSATESNVPPVATQST